MNRFSFLFLSTLFFSIKCFGWSVEAGNLAYDILEEQQNPNGQGQRENVDPERILKQLKAPEGKTVSNDDVTMLTILNLAVNTDLGQALANNPSLQDLRFLHSLADIALNQTAAIGIELTNEVSLLANTIPKWKADFDTLAPKVTAILMYESAIQASKKKLESLAKQKNPNKARIDQVNTYLNNLTEKLAKMEKEIAHFGKDKIDTTKRIVVITAFLEANQRTEQLHNKIEAAIVKKTNPRNPLEQEPVEQAAPDAVHI
jgi:hypothetical protein